MKKRNFAAVSSFRGKKVLTGEKSAFFTYFLLALLYPSDYNSRWKSFGMQELFRFFTTARDFSRWSCAACLHDSRRPAAK